MKALIPVLKLKLTVGDPSALFFSKTEALG